MQVSEPRDPEVLFAVAEDGFYLFLQSVSWPRKVRPLRLGNYNQDVTLFAIFASTNSCPHSSLYRQSVKASAPSDSKGAGITPSGPHCTYVVFPDRDQRIARPALYDLKWQAINHKVAPGIGVHKP
jgi:hypothetical protein